MFEKAIKITRPNNEQFEPLGKKDPTVAKRGKDSESTNATGEKNPNQSDNLTRNTDTADVILFQRNILGGYWVRTPQPMLQRCKAVMKSRSNLKQPTSTLRGSAI